MAVKAKNKAKSIFALLGADDNLLGYFKDFESVEQYMEKEFLEECTILEVVAVTDAAMPPEPDLEFTERELLSLLE